MLSVLAPTLVIWADPKGDDRAAGTAAKPVATLEEVTRRLAARPTGTAATVRLRGTFRRTGPWRLGKEAGDVTILGPATISGGEPVTGWRPGTFRGRPTWSAPLATPLFRQLWTGADERRTERPRWPETGFAHLAAYADPKDASVAWNVGQRSAFLAPGVLAPGTPDVDLVVHHYWVASRLPVASVTADGLATFDRPSVWKLNDDHGVGMAPFVMENDPAHFSKPGTWYHDRAGSTLHYLPKPGERIDRFRAVRPVAATLLEVEGAANLTIKNVDFRHTEWMHADTAGDIQAACTVPGAVRLKNCTKPLLERLTVSRTGTYGIEIGEGTREATVDRCLLTDLGAGGVKLESGSAATTVKDCVIRSGGRLHPSGIGVFGMLSGGNRILHNRIEDLYYSGVSLGWQWGFEDTTTKDNLIEGNDIARIGQGKLSDMGGIYVLGKQPGSVMRGNRLRGVDSRGYGGWGVYLDEGSTGWTVERNVVVGTKSGGFHIHYGGDNVMRENVFAHARTEGQLIRSRDDQQGPILFERNLVVARPGDAPIVVGSWLKRDVVLTGTRYASPKVPLPLGDDGTGRFVTATVDAQGRVSGLPEFAWTKSARYGPRR